MVTAIGRVQLVFNRMDNYGQEVAEAKIREKLNTDKVKLWLPPYTTAENQKGEMPKVLTKSFVI